MVVKLNVLENAPLPQPFTALTRQKCWVFEARPTVDVHVGFVRPVADATIFVNAASVATSILYVEAPATALHVNVGKSTTPGDPFAGDVSEGAEGAAARTMSETGKLCPIEPVAEPTMSKL